MAVCYQQMSKTGITDLITTEVRTAPEESEPEWNRGFGELRRLLLSLYPRRNKIVVGVVVMNRCWFRGGQRFHLISVQLTGDSLSHPGVMRSETLPARSFCRRGNLREPGSHSLTAPTLIHELFHFFINSAFHITS